MRSTDAGLHTLVFLAGFVCVLMTWRPTIEGSVEIMISDVKLYTITVCSQYTAVYRGKEMDCQLNNEKNEIRVSVNVLSQWQ